jgi:hypothetical protein
MNGLRLLCLLIVAASTTAVSAREPRVPASDDEVVERLSVVPDPAQRARRAALARDPSRLPLALEEAQAAIGRFRRGGDPRELGAAQAALSAWWSQPAAPAPVRLLRASILQSRHDFDAAQKDLDALVADPAAPLPLQAQALLTRASLAQVRGRMLAAKADCVTLSGSRYAALGPVLERAARACVAEIDSLTGDPRAAWTTLAALGQGAQDDAWLALIRAELAERLGAHREAGALYAVASSSGEVYALAAHADWLLSRGRWREVDALLAPRASAADALLLRQAIAWHQGGDPRARDAVALLKARFAAVRQRGDSPHWREEARLALDVDGDAARALELAQAQWAQQREPADALLLWRAAQAARRPEAARALRDWLPDPARADIRLAGSLTATAPGAR